MQFDGQPHAAICHILHDERIDTRLGELLCKGACLVEFVVEQQGVEGGIETGSVDVGIFDGFGYLLCRIRSRITRSEPRTAHIDGIGSAIYRILRRSKVAGRSEQFDFAHFADHRKVSAKIANFV